MSRYTAVLLMGLAPAVVGAVSCRLDASNKLGCGTSADCLNGAVCLDRKCASAASSTSVPPPSSERFVNPDQIMVNFLDSTGCFRVSWRDRSDVETGFELRRSADPVATESTGYSYLARAAANATQLDVCFDRAESFRLRVCALREGELAACSEDETVSVSFSQVYEANPTQCPTTPAANSSLDTSGRIWFSWAAETVDFRDNDLKRCGFQLLQCRMSPATCQAMPEAWEFVTSAASSELSLSVQSEVEGVMTCSYALTAYNRYGASTGWVSPALPCAR